LQITMQRLRRHIAATALLAMTLAPRTGHADGWLTVEAPAAAAVSDVQSHVFRAGAMPALGVYHGTDVWALGLRGRLGVLRDGPALDEPGVMEPGTGGLASVTGAVRLGVNGGWAELAIGAGVTGDDVAPVVEGGVGYWFATKRFDLGPSLRYMRLVSLDGEAKLGTADVVLLGVDFRFGKDRKRPVTRELPFVAAAPEPAPREPVVERDPEVAIVDTDAPCTNDTDGCAVVVSPDLPLMIDDRITLTDDVLFDFNRARVKRSGRRIVHALATAWEEHPEWQRVTIEGHADVRGSDAWNLTLSQMRAERVREVLVREHGVDPTRITAVGYGRTRPRDGGRSEAAHQRNRRVEFVVDREVAQ
jgi:OmpA-OmpF porin, OOP family